MSNNAQILTVIGNLPALLPGEYVDINPGLCDQAGNTLLPNSVSVGGGVVWYITLGIVRFVNASTNTLPSGLNAIQYKISHDHSIQTQYPTPTGTAAAPAVLLSQVRGTLEAFLSDKQPFAAATPTPLEFPLINTLRVGRIELLVDQVAPQNFDILATDRALEIQAKVSCESVAVAEEAVALQIFEADGATILAEATGTSTAGEPVNLSAQCIIPATVLGSRIQARLLSTEGGAALAASLIIKTLD